jgi:hypothetical protein
LAWLDAHFARLIFQVVDLRLHLLALRFELANLIPNRNGTAAALSHNPF